MTPWVTRLLVANVVMFFIQQIAPQVTLLLGFVPAYTLFRPWTPITYMFLHGGLGHLFFNMLALFFFGPRLERHLGSKQFLLLYFISGLVAAAVSFPFTPLARIIGASGAVFGVLIGFARYWPHDKIYIWGVLPLEARTLVIIMTVLSLWGGLGLGASNVAHFAHLGGFLGGYLYIKWWESRSPAAQFKKKASAVSKRRLGGDGADVQRWQDIARDDMHPVNREELDRVLDKISQSGVSSLSPDERAFLERFASK